MKKTYEKPEMEKTEYTFEDVIAASTWVIPGDDGKPESGAPDIFSML